jgi:hypothetical protein
MVKAMPKMVFVGLVLLGVLGLFPPLQPIPGTLLAGSQNKIWAPRTFLLTSGDYTYSVPTPNMPAAGLRQPAQIDSGRLLAEALIVVSVVCGIAAAWPRKARSPS